MFGLSKKKEKYSVPLAAPVFTASEKEVLRGIKASPVQTKVRKHLDYVLINRFLNTNDCSEEFKRGYLTCRQAMDNLPIAKAEEEPKVEFTSMQEV